MLRLLSILALLSALPAHAYTLLPSEMKGWGWRQSTILAGMSGPLTDTAQDLQLMVPGKAEGLAVRLWKIPSPRGLVLLLPGTGGGSASGISNILAEAVNKLGFDALVLANPFGPEFQKTFSSCGLVGVPHLDLADSHRMLEVAVRFYTRQYGKPERLVLVGSSLGAIYALLEANPKSNLAIDTFLALNPPVNLAYGMGRLDQMIRASAGAPSEDEELDFFWAFFRAQTGVTPAKAEKLRELLPKKSAEAEKIIGGSFQQTLAALLAGSFAAAPKFFTLAVQQKISLPSVTFERYAGYLTGALASEGETVNFSELFAEVELTNILARIGENKRVYLITSADDFLLRAGDLTKLEGLLGSRMHVFEAGGHCGNYWTESFQRLLGEILQ